MATLTVPAAYLEDARSAVVAGIVSDGDMLRTNHQSVLEGRFGGMTEDRTSAAATLHRDMRLLDQIVDADGEVTLEGDSGDLSFVLEEVVRLLAARLDEAKEYSPIDMAAVLNIAKQLRWAAEESSDLYQEA